VNEACQENLTSCYVAHACHKFASPDLGYTRVAKSALSAARLERTLANGPVFATCVASCYDLPVNHLMILPAASPRQCSSITTSLQLHVSTFIVQMSVENDCVSLKQWCCYPEIPHQRHSSLVTLFC
jgi:hypothetical protein